MSCLSCDLRSCESAFDTSSLSSSATGATGAGCNVKETLQAALTPPSEKQIDSTLSFLRRIEAIESSAVDSTSGAENDDEAAERRALFSLTPLGCWLAALPIDIHLGRMLIVSCTMRCLDPILTIAASIESGKSPFVSPFEEQKRAAANTAHKKFVEASGACALFSFVNAFAAYQRAKAQRKDADFCDANYINRRAMQVIEKMRLEYVRLLASIGFVQNTDVRAFSASTAHLGAPMAQTTQARASAHAAAAAPLFQMCAAAWQTPAPLNEHARTLPVLQATLVSGLYPNIVRKEVAPNSTKALWYDEKRTLVHVHPSSSYFSSANGGAVSSAYRGARFMLFHERFKTSRTFITGCTAVNAKALLLFGGALHLHLAEGAVRVDEWLPMRAAPKTAVIFEQLKQITREMLNAKFENPEANDEEALNLILKILKDRQ